MGTVLWLACSGPAEAGGRVFGEFSFGAESDDSVLRDASGRRDKAFPSFLGLGWRGRLARRTTGRVYYRFSYKGHAREKRETRHSHLGEAVVRHRFYGALSLVLEAEAEAYRQPRINRLDSNRLVYKPGLEWRPLADTRLSGFYTYEIERYPRFDLDSRAPGFEARIEQEIVLSGRVAARYAYADRLFAERGLFRDSTASLLDAKRRDVERELEAEIEGDWRYGGLAAGYSWRRTTSNGNLVDFGPNQSQTNNTTVGDERLLDNYYSRRARGPRVEGRLGHPSWATVAISQRWEEVRYDGRIAKNAADRFVAGDPKRVDGRWSLSVRVTKVMLTDPLSVSLVLGWARERSRSNDSLYSFTNDRFSVSLRGRF